MKPEEPLVAGLSCGVPIGLLSNVAAQSGIYVSIGFIFGVMCVYGAWAFQAWLMGRLYKRKAEKLHEVMKRNSEELDACIRDQQAIWNVLHDPRVLAANEALAQIARDVAKEQGVPFDVVNT